MKKRFALVMFVLLPLAGWGQLIFNRTFFGPPGSNQIAWSSTVDSAGNIYVAGQYKYTNPFHWLTLMKLDSAGNLLWSKADSFAYSGRKVKTLSDGNLMILGLVQENWPPYYRNSTLLLKTDTAGNTLWSRLYYDTLSFSAVDFVEMPDKGFILTGGRYDLTNQDEGRIFLMRTDSVGAVLWCKLYGNGYPGYYPRSVVSTHDGGFMVGGNMVDIEDIVVFRTDSVGNLVWSKQFGGAKNDRLESLIALSNGNYAFGGSSNSFLGAGSWPPFNQLLFQFDSTGNKIFCKVYFQGGSLSEHCNALAETVSGKIIITGVGTTKMIDTNGNAILWNALYMNSSVFVTPDQGIVFTGEYGINPQIHILRTDSFFNPPCYNFNFNPPMQVSLQDTFLPLSLNEMWVVPFDSVINVTFFNFNLFDSLYCLTATGIFQPETDPAISIVPNPFTEYISLINADEVSIDMLYVYDLSGALVKTIKYTGGKVDLSFLSSGMYFVKLFSIKKSFIKILKICKID